MLTAIIVLLTIIVVLLFVIAMQFKRVRYFMDNVFDFVGETIFRVIVVVFLGFLLFVVVKLFL